jgi:nucleotide-binding universal stress UspA family protein
MVSRVLVPTDGSEMAERALRYALEVHSGADITVLHVVGEPSPMLARATGLALADDVEEAAEEHAEAVLDRATAIAAEYDAEIDTAVRMGHPAKAIVESAPQYDVVVLGSHGGDIADNLFIGNVAKRVFRRSPVPVTTVR